MTFKERDNPTGDAGMMDQSALNDREVQRHPESGDKCTQRAGISVPDESTYAPSIRKMISPPREFTAKAQSQR